MNLNDDQLAIFLNQNEMQYILNLLGAQSLVGIEPSLLTGTEPGVGRESLLSRELSQSGQPGENDRIRGDLLHMLIPVLFPERALVVVKNIPNMGTQTLIFLHRDKTTVLHSMPQNDFHRLIELETSVDGVNAVTEWFPFSGYLGSSVNALIPSGKLDQFKNYAETDQEQLAMETLKSVQMPQEEKMRLFQTFKEATVSGSFALLTLNEDSITSAESISILADQTSAWAITRPEKNTRQNTYLVRRTGDDFPNIIQKMFVWLGNG